MLGVSSTPDFRAHRPYSETVQHPRNNCEDLVAEVAPSEGWEPSIQNRRDILNTTLLIRLTAHKSPFLWWWCYPTPSERWGRGGTPRRPNSRETP